MTGAVDVGGGMRGAYTAGFYDYLLDHGIMLQYCIGVSAGSANMLTYLAKQRGRSVRYYLEYARRKEYMSLNNVRKGGAYLNLDYAYSTLANSGGESPFDYDEFSKSSSRFAAVATDAVTGLAAYFKNDSISRDNYDVLKASCSLPLACKPRMINGVPYFDGGIADPVPYKRALADGCDRVIVLLTRPRTSMRSPQKQMKLLRRALQRYPRVASGLAKRHIRYNRAVQEIKQLEKSGRVLLLAPRDIMGMKTLSRNTDSVQRLYNMGYGDGRLAERFLSQ